MFKKKFLILMLIVVALISISVSGCGDSGGADSATVSGSGK